MKTPALMTIALMLATAPAFAARIELIVQLPQIEVAEYHRPYLAVWIEREDSTVAADLAVWYQQDRDPPAGPAGKGESGSKWLPDLRQWWRRSGRGQALPIDAVSGATRPVGRHELRFDAGQPPLGDLPSGQYRLVVEAAREVGGRELLKLPLAWPPAAASEQRVQGRTELGEVQLRLTP